MTSPDDRTTRADFWQQHVQQWKSTPLSQVAYCREHALNFHRFNYWYRKTDPVKPKKESAPLSASFVPVVTSPTTPEGLSLHLPNGMVLQGIDSANLSSVKQLMELFS